MSFNQELTKTGLQDLTRDIVFQTAATLDQKGDFAKGYSKYDVIVKGKPYPVTALMNEFVASNIMLRRHGKIVNEQLSSLGFKVVDKYSGKVDVIKDVVEKYKARTEAKGIEGERYKYQLIKAFADKWDIDAPDFANMVKSINFDNLVYPLAKRALDNMVQQHPEPVWDAFKYLYDESLALQDRITGFLEKLNDVHDLVKTAPNHTSWHDERSVASYLAFRYPDKYFLYKDSFYGPLCSLLGIKKAPAGRKYSHYMELAEDIRDNYIINDAGLLETIDALKDDSCYEDPKRTILTQDVLYTVLDKEANNPHEKPLLKRMAEIGNRKSLELYFNHLNTLFNGCSISEDDPFVYCTVRKDVKRIAFTYGQRYIHYVERKKDEIEFGFIVTPEDAKKYRKSKQLNKGNFGGAFSMSFITVILPATEVESYDFATLIDDCIAGLSEEKERGSKFSFKEGNNKNAHNPLIYAMAIDQEYRNEMIAKALKEPALKPIIDEVKPQAPQVNMAKNIILYGPPGTGKTYSTIDLAVTIVGKGQGNHKKNKEQFDALRKDGYIEFITFHQNYSYEDFVVGLRPAESAGNLVFKKHEGIFYELCKRAEANYLNSKKGATVTSFEGAFESYIKPVAEGKEVPVKLLSGEGTFYIYDVNETTIFFRKQNGNTDHSLSIATLKDMYHQTRDIVSGIKYYYKAIVRDLKATQSKPSTEQLRNYVLIIDEINRANISKVFGELITLLEEDKRIDGDNELRVTLPNGERSFGVPPNLYIIGTMNTADKSIAHIDIALRRRFDFIGKYPVTDDLSPLFSKVLTGLNKSILEYKKSPDFLIGHGYFIGRPDSDLNRIVKNKVLPLLNEYFIGRTDIIKDTLRAADISFKENTILNQVEVD